MCKSVQKIKNKTKSNMLYDPRKSMSISKMKNKKQMTASTFGGKQSPKLEAKVKKVPNNVNCEFIELEDIKFREKANAAESKNSDLMRSKLFLKEQTERE